MFTQTLLKITKIKHFSKLQKLTQSIRLNKYITTISTTVTTCTTNYKKLENFTKCINAFTHFY